MACAVHSAVAGKTRPLEELVASGAIRYIPFPEELSGRYQSYTQADTGALRAAGYEDEFTTLEDGVDSYVSWRKEA